MKRSLNLIPVATQRRQALARVLRVWSVSVVLAGMATSLLLGIEWTRGMVAVRRLNEVEARYAPYERIASKQSDLAALIERLRAREQLSLRLSREARGLALLGVIAGAAKASGGAVYLESLEYDGSAADGSPSEDRGEVLLAGAGSDSTAIAHFAEHLRRSGAFTDIALQSTRPIAGGTTARRQFEIACTL